MAFMSLAYACAAHADDFRTKVAAGCHSGAECAALVQLAQDRYLACYKAAATESGCAEEQKDKATAQDAMNAFLHSGSGSQEPGEEFGHEGLRERAERERIARERQEEGQRAVAERQRADAMRDRIRELENTATTCEGLAEFEAYVRANLEDGATGARRHYLEAIQSRRDDFVRSAKYAVDWRIDRPLNLPVADDPAAALKDIEPTLATAEGMRCYDAAAADAAKQAAEAWADATRKAVAAEQACRASPICMGGRAAEPLCEVIRDRREAVRAMATERSNPSGVVDLRNLHDLGAQIQRNDQQIVEMKAEYARVAKRAFSEALCKFN